LGQASDHFLFCAMVLPAVPPPAQKGFLRCNGFVHCCVRRRAGSRTGSRSS